MLSTEITRPLPGLEGISPLGVVAPEMTIELGFGPAGMFKAGLLVHGVAIGATILTGVLVGRKKGALWGVGAGVGAGVVVELIGGLVVAGKVASEIERQSASFPSASLP